MARLDIETLHPRELAATDVRTWRKMIADEPAFASPLLSPDFAQAVGAVRPDARISIIRQTEETVGFLAHHRRPGRLARPIGSPLSDYHAVISTPDAHLVGHEILDAADLSAFRYSGLVDPHGVFTPARHKSAHVVALGAADAQAYLEAVRAASPKKIKNWRRLDNKLEREVGALKLIGPDYSRAAFNQLIAWKRAQLQRTGVHDFLRADWTSELMENLFLTRQGAFQGLMICLYADGQLIGGHFGVRTDEVYHPWIASTNPDHAVWSPGQIFLMRAIAAMPDLGLSVYDLGPGHDHYKGAYALSQVQVGEGAATASDLGGRVASSLDEIWTLAGGGGGGPVGKLRRRMDAVASVELTLSGRVMGMAHAFASRAQRHAS